MDQVRLICLGTLWQSSPRDNGIHFNGTVAFPCFLGRKFSLGFRDLPLTLTFPSNHTIFYEVKVIKQAQIVVQECVPMQSGPSLTVYMVTSRPENWGACSEEKQNTLQWGGSETA